MWSVSSRVVIAASLTAILTVPNEILAAPPQTQQERNERERRRQEERTAEREAKQAHEAAETLREVQAELDELAVDLLEGRYEDPFLQDYVNELGQSLVPKETPPGVLFSFRVLRNPVPNAMALPDGRVFVNSGLLVFVENEAQLATILGHEIGHVTEQHYVKSVKNARKEQLLGTIFGSAAGAIFGGIFGGKKGAIEGAGVGTAAGVAVAHIRVNSYSRQQEDEADRVGVQLAMDRRFDSREAVAFFQKLNATFGEQDRFSNALYGRHSRNRDRISNIQALLGGDLATSYNRLKSAGELTAGTGQMHMYASRMVRDVAISLMDDFDRYALAKTLLERIIDYRASDPKTLWALGRVYKLVARTDADRAKALDFLQRAAQLDQRNLYPFTYRELGLMQARLGSAPAAAESLRKYILGHITKHYEYPADLEEMYDYLLTFGDRNWTAPAVEPLVVRAKRGPDLTGAPAQHTSPVNDAAAKPALPKPAVKPPVKPLIKKSGGGNDR